MASNVLNVQENDEDVNDLLTTIIDTLEDGGKAIVNFPSTPRKHKDFQDEVSMENKLNSHFDVVKRVGGSKAEPIFELSNPKEQEVPDSRMTFGMGTPASRYQDVLDAPDEHPRLHEYLKSISGGGVPSELTDDKETVDVFRKIQQNPNASVTIYRAVPEGISNIDAGDWIALSRKYAEMHLRNKSDKIISQSVTAKDVANARTSADEWIFVPDENTPVTKLHKFIQTPEVDMKKSWWTNPRGAKDPHGKSIRKEGDGAGAFGEGGGVAFTSTDSGIFTPTHSERDKQPKKKKRSGVDRLADFLVDDSPERKMEKETVLEKFLPMLIGLLGSTKASSNNKHFHQQTSGETINNQPPRIDWAKGNKEMPREDGVSEFDGKPNANAAISQKDEERRIRRLNDSDDKKDDEPKGTGAASQAAPAGLNIRLAWESGGHESDALRSGSSKDKEKGEVEDPADEHSDEEFISNKTLKRMIKAIDES